MTCHLVLFLLKWSYWIIKTLSFFCHSCSLFEIPKYDRVPSCILTVKKHQMICHSDSYGADLLDLSSTQAYTFRWKIQFEMAS